ncbi:MAG: hypothetical protein GY809_21520 [Planctomycetes bacterium]|nr:hypothetical protein [Planctomycetota bacterium]
MLDEQETVLSVHPPRMPSWQRPFRRIARSLRPSRVKPGRITAPKFQLDWISTPKRLLLAMGRSLVPGLAHAKQRRFRQIRWYMLAWALSMTLAGLMFSSPLGWTFLGLAAAFHAWIALDSWGSDALDGALNRLRILMITFALTFAAYALVIRVIPWNFAFRRTPLTIASQEIHSGDILLLRDITDYTQPLARGTMVQYQADMIGRGGQVEAIGQIVGLPNEVVTIRERVYYINGQRLSVEDFPVPGWIRAGTHQVGVRSGQYFISTEYRIQGRVDRMNSAIKELCLVSRYGVESQATMVWWPLNRRHSLRQN